MEPSFVSKDLIWPEAKDSIELLLPKKITDIHVLHQIHCQCHTLLKRQMHIIYIITIWFEKHTVRTIIIGKNHFYE